MMDIRDCLNWLERCQYYDRDGNSIDYTSLVHYDKEENCWYPIVSRVQHIKYIRATMSIHLSMLMAIFDMKFINLIYGFDESNGVYVRENEREFVPVSYVKNEMAAFWQAMDKIDPPPYKEL